MKLTVMERMTLIGILPPAGNFVTLKIVRKLREALSFGEGELKALSVKEIGNGRVSWDPEKEEPDGKEIEIGEKATDIIVEALKKLDEDSKLTEQHFSLYEKFVDSKPE